MKGIHVLGLIFFSLLAIAGLMTANGVTGNIVAGCDCITSACIKACGESATQNCCMTTAQESKTVPQYPPWAGYTASFVGLAGFFLILANNKKEDDFY